ncbi:GDP-L-fucose synthase [Pseudomonas otitidis]|uniref:GDP-L-fucose synthase n=1 Tax=Metapseudomonas otitidis TaxID=319939 RepID=A0ABU3XR31_9GAMM|nr:GDP-L-fucose synthase [Pseudomonas otitidis]MDV3440370.1 GDP-L-fucose synthase [Pseudomonas otitidis]MEE1891712.1 GDP-L-fucose synthase [Pseudomonas otitidis]WMR33225.1 GDP-L-fucose synthase [Pseudomonas otitidis]
MSLLLSQKTRIYIAGHLGMIGSAFVRHFNSAGFNNLILREHKELELTDRLAVEHFFSEQRPDVVILAAGKVGGIVDNINYPADFITQNLEIQSNVIQSAHQYGTKRLLFFGSSCMYPRECSQPMAEDTLLSGKPELTSIAYAVAKLAGVHMCLAYNRQYGEQRFIPVIPNSVYGPNDNFDPQTGHVLSALISRFHWAVQAGDSVTTLWGSGQPRREFLHVDDLANACHLLLRSDLSNVELPINIGSGSELRICELAQLIARAVGFQGDISWDTGRPDGTMRKLLDSSRLQALGWKAGIDLETGIHQTYASFLESGYA